MAMKDKIYIELLDEGSPVWRPTEGVDMGRGVFLVLPTDNYDPDDEIWAFPPGTYVICEKKTLSCGEVLVATRLAEGIADPR